MGFFQMADDFLGNVAGSLKLSGTGSLDQKVARMVAKRETGSLLNQKGLGKAFYSDITKSYEDLSTLDSGFMKALKGGNLNEAEKIAKKVGGETLNAYQTASKNTVNRGTTLNNLIKDNGSTEDLRDIMDIGDGIGSKADFYSRAAGAYFLEDGKKAARIGTAVGAYAGVSMGIRSLDGGTATRNSSGERDIAGVPFF